MPVMHISNVDVEYMHGRLQAMNEGDQLKWSLRDRAVVSRLLIILEEHKDHIVDIDHMWSEDEAKLEPKNE